MKDIQANKNYERTHHDVCACNLLAKLRTLQQLQKEESVRVPAREVGGESVESERIASRMKRADACKRCERIEIEIMCAGQSSNSPRSSTPTENARMLKT